MSLARNVAQALEEIVNARKEHDAAFEGYGGYSWGYHGRIFIERVDKAEERFAEILNQHIDERIKEVLAARDPA